LINYYHILIQNHLSPIKERSFSLVSMYAQSRAEISE